MTYPEGRKERSFRPFLSLGVGLGTLPAALRAVERPARRGAERPEQRDSGKRRARESGGEGLWKVRRRRSRWGPLASRSGFFEAANGGESVLRERGNFRRKFPKLSRFPARPARVRWSARRSCVRTLSRQAAPLLRASAVSPASCGAAFPARRSCAASTMKKADPVEGSAMMVKRMSSAFLPRLAEGSGVSSAPRPSRAPFPDPAARRSCAVRSRGEDP